MASNETTRVDKAAMPVSKCAKCEYSPLSERSDGVIYCAKCGFEPPQARKSQISDILNPKLLAEICNTPHPGSVHCADALYQIADEMKRKRILDRAKFVCSDDWRKARNFCMSFDKSTVAELDAVEGEAIMAWLRDLARDEK